MVKSPGGPSVKFLVNAVHTMEELKLTGNHLKGSLPLLTFSSNFDNEPRWKLVKEIIMQNIRNEVLNGRYNVHSQQQREGFPFNCMNAERERQIDQEQFLVRPLASLALTLFLPPRTRAAAEKEEAEDEEEEAEDEDRRRFENLADSRAALIDHAQEQLRRKRLAQIQERRLMKHELAQGFVYGIVPYRGKPMSGASNSLRSWWKETVRFDTGIQKRGGGE